MEFLSVDSVQSNFCKDQDLTTSIVGDLQGRKIKVIATDSFIGRLIHKIRYFFSKEYHRQFDEVAEKYVQIQLLNKNRFQHYNPDAPLFLHTPEKQPEIIFENLVPKTPVVKDRIPENKVEAPVPETIDVEDRIPENLVEDPVPETLDVEARLHEIRVEKPVAKVLELPDTMRPMFQQIELKLNLNAAILWRTLFTRFASDPKYGQGFLKGIVRSGDTFELTFTKPLKMHLLATDVVKGKVVEDPPGGVVMIFGENEPLKITIEKGNMKFEGLKTFSKAPFGLGKLVGDPVEARLASFKPLAGDQFEIIGEKKTLFKTFAKANTKPFQKILENWGKTATILASDTEPASVILKK